MKTGISREAGMTIVEGTVYVLMFTVIMLATVTSVQYFYRINSYSIQQATAVASAQGGIDKMIRTIREASYASSGAYPIISFGPYDIKFYANIDSGSSVEEVHYYIATSSPSYQSLFRGTISPTGDPPVYGTVESTSTLSDYVRNVYVGTPIFTYYDQNGTQVTDYTKIAAVRFVSASLLVDVDPNRSPVPLTLRSSSALRNLVGH